MKTQNKNQKKKIVNDPKTKEITIQEFITNNFMNDVIFDKNKLWNDYTVPEPYEVYWKFTADKLIKIVYDVQYRYGLYDEPLLGSIEFAIRDGKTEYSILETAIQNAKNGFVKEKKKKAKKPTLELLKEIYSLLPKYQKPIAPQKRNYKSFLGDTGTTTNDESLKQKYLVFDVETNGTRWTKDDLLSLSIYDPTTGEFYSRFLPLDRQPLVLTGYINGITDEQLENCFHMTQQEINWLISHFNMKERILLSYSGKFFDYYFITNYCKRNGLTGFESLKYENIKSCIPKAPFGSEGNLTKDNLCKIFRIKGVTKFHSSLNDCVLEWKLFEKIKSKTIFFINNEVYEYKPEYILPVTYLNKYFDQFTKNCGLRIPKIEARIISETIFPFPKSVVKFIKKFPTNQTGMAIEHAISAQIGAVYQDNRLFLSRNKRNLEYLGTLGTRLIQMPVLFTNDGLLKAMNKEDADAIKAINGVSKVIMDNIKELIQYIKGHIFKQGLIKSQELVISKSEKVLALCDFSNEDAILELKTFNVSKKDDNCLDDNVGRQLFFESKGRKTFLLVVDFQMKEHSFEEVKGLNIILYEAKIDVIDGE